jgi:hypothetical protein
MLAGTPDVDGPERKAGFQPEERSDEGVLDDGSVGLSVARMGLEFPHRGAPLTRDQGLSPVREACCRVEEQVSSLRRKYDAGPQGDEDDPGVARVVYIRESPIVLAEGMQPAGVDEEQATAWETGKELA